MNIHMIWAQDNNNAIGRDGTLPWHFSEDLKNFKKLTIGSPIIMGRKTWESLPINPLPDRRNIVLSSTEQEDVENYSSIEDCIASLNDDTFNTSFNHLKQAISLSERLGAKNFGFHAGFFIDIRLGEIGKKLTKDNQLNLRLFQQLTEIEIETSEYKRHLLPFSHRGGIQLAHEDAEVLPLDTVEDYQNWIGRLKNLDRRIKQTIN